jgi:glucose/arabinose dehydrogenase/putative cell wall-binding protein
VPLPATATAAARRRRALAALLLLVAAVPPAAPGPASAQPQEERIGTSADPVVRSVELERARLDAVGGRRAARVVLGRADVFADTLAATALAGADGALLLTDGGADATLRPEVAEQLAASLAPGGCDGGSGPTAYLVGGDAALSSAVEAAVRDLVEGCVVRLAGGDRVATAVTVAGAVPGPSDTVVLARADDPADAGAVGAWAAATASRVLVTAGDALDERVAAALERAAPEEVVLVGGPAALSAEVEAAASSIAPARRVAGGARDATAVAIAEQLWAPDTTGRALADGSAPDAWTTLFAGAPLAAARRTPILLTADGRPTAVTQAHLDAVRPATLLRLGPPAVAPALADVRVELVRVAALDAPLMLKARPGSDELWVAERDGRVVALAPDGSTRTVLDLAPTVSTDGERGLLGLAFTADGTTLYTSSTDPDGHSVVDAFAVVGDAVDAASRREVIQVDQPASNHNGGDLQVGPDGMLWWALGDGGGGGDPFGNGQRPDTLLGTIVRIDPAGGTPYAIPADNPFTGGRTPDGRPARPEVWAYGLRNPFRFDLDDATGDLYVADVGQGAVEEVDHLPGRAGGAVPAGGTNFGWNVWEGTRRFADGEAPGHVPPVWEQLHDDGHCSITGGVVYRGSALPQLVGAYLYSDLCDPSVEAVLVEGGRVVQSADLGGQVGTPVGFGTDHDGEVLVLSLGGDVLRMVPAGGS